MAGVLVSDEGNPPLPGEDKFDWSGIPAICGCGKKLTLGPGNFNNVYVHLLLCVEAMGSHGQHIKRFESFSLDMCAARLRQFIVRKAHDREKLIVEAMIGEPTPDHVFCEQCGDCLSCDPEHQC